MESRRPTDLLTTGEAAALLGTSRQHVVDLCTTGRLRYQRVGVHRRVSRIDVEVVREQSLTLSPDQERSLWLHRAVAGKLAIEPERTLERAQRNLGKLRRVHGSGTVREQFDAWQQLLSGPLSILLDFLVSKSPIAVEMRQNSPFAGVLTERERRLALRAFHESARAA